MVLDWICHNVKHSFKIADCTLNAFRYRNDILGTFVLPFIRQRYIYHFFQQVIKHQMSRIKDLNGLSWTKSYLGSFLANISSDFFSLEHLWDQLIGRRFRKRQNQPETLQDLRFALIQELQLVPKANIITLIECKRRSCESRLYSLLNPEWHWTIRIRSRNCKERFWSLFVTQNFKTTNVIYLWLDFLR